MSLRFTFDLAIIWIILVKMDRINLTATGGGADRMGWLVISASNFVFDEGVLPVKKPLLAAVFAICLSSTTATAQNVAVTASAVNVGTPGNTTIVLQADGTYTKQANQTITLVLELGTTTNSGVFAGRVPPVVLPVMPAANAMGTGGTYTGTFTNNALPAGTHTVQTRMTVKTPGRFGTVTTYLYATSSVVVP
jgi:hypothetical protein